jgi:hypothetical protein
LILLQIFWRKKIVRFRRDMRSEVEKIRSDAMSQTYMG